MVSETGYSSLVTKTQVGSLETGVRFLAGKLPSFSQHPDRYRDPHNLLLNGCSNAYPVFKVAGA
jgi:hypothetical protein